TTISIRRADGTTATWCVLVADTPEERGRGLMSVDSLDGYDGMLFRFGEPTTAAFYMFQTEIPLSIAWFAADGAFVSATDMPPCPSTDAGGCPLFRASGPYTAALEVPHGDLERLGATAGSTLAVPGAPCPPP